MKKIIVALIILATGICSVLVNTSAYAASSVCSDDYFKDDKDLLAAAGCDTIQNADKTVGNTGLNLINVVLSVTGVVAVIVMIVGGVLMGISAGNPERARAGRFTVMYGLIGLVVCLLAGAIVNFVIKNV